MCIFNCFQVVNCKVDSRDLEFAVFASQQTADGVKLTNLTTSILKMKGSVCSTLNYRIGARSTVAQLTYGSCTIKAPATLKGYNIV